MLTVNSKERKPSFTSYGKNTAHKVAKLKLINHVYEMIFVDYVSDTSNTLHEPRAPRHATSCRLDEGALTCIFNGQKKKRSCAGFRATTNVKADV